MAYRVILALWVLVLLAAATLFSFWSSSIWMGGLEAVLVTLAAALLVGGAVSILVAAARLLSRLGRPRGRTATRR